MANQEHLDKLKQGVKTWNAWRQQHPEVKPDLIGVNLEEADLTGAYLRAADLRNANLRKAKLCGADLYDADLCVTDLTQADLSNATLEGAKLLQTTLTQACLTNCSIYGISAWGVHLEGAQQHNLVITLSDEPTITVDNLKVAQFIYLLLENKEIRDVIDTVAKKAVLILGRFTPERKAVLDALRETLRTYGYLPILFDFEKPSSRNFTETVRTLAHLARFIIADLTDPSSIPQELQAIVPTLAVPVQPVLLEGKREYAMFVDFLKTYHWVLPVHYYLDQVHLLTTLKEQVIEPAEQKAKELEER
jgi:Pentapeptide repeats (8 copies)